ncbi:antitoxin of type II TA system, VapB [Thermosipho atlanticus DSM 15807]|uniref:Antitoxin of type II TA system, VapB n=2 Tax=Thermosipho TaxID=2420 RepID=A0A1M5TBV2_9BACT|nr:antitoxin of type II TA system, VapB [Thermosipho atlanticus DSM 15807]
MMRTNIVIDDALIEEAMKLSNLKTKKEVVNLALKEFVQTRKRKNLKDLKGKIEFADDYDYKKMRKSL